MEFTLDDVIAYLRANPQLTADQIAQLAAENGVPMGLVQQAIQTLNQQPATGLIGAEQAFAGGLEGAIGGIQEGLAAGQAGLERGTGQAVGVLEQAYNLGERGIQQGMAGGEGILREAYNLGERELREGRDEAVGALQQGSADAQQMMMAGGLQGREDLTQGVQSALAALAQGRGDIQGGTQQALNLLAGAQGQSTGFIDPYNQSGQRALSPLEALSGARGQDAFNQAYIESPYVQFLREQGERSVLANQAATGGLGGGNVLKELTRFGQGLAGQGLQQQIGNLQNLANMGLSAGGQQANIAGQFGLSGAQAAQRGGEQLAGMSQQAAGLQSGLGANLAGLESGTTTNIGNLLAGTGQNIAGIRTGTGQALAGQAQNLGGLGAAQQFTAGQNLGNLAQSLGTTGANIYSNLGQGLGNMGFQAGLAGGQAALGTGAQVAQNRQQVGNLLAGNIANTMAGVGGLAQGQGQETGQAIAQQTGNLANLLTQAGLSQAQIAQILAQSQAGAAQTAAGQYAGLPGVPGVQQNTGMLGSIGQFAGGVGTLLGSF
jgi:hypothetical protein